MTDNSSLKETVNNERDIMCKSCSSDLMEIERFLYGDECVFCVENPEGHNLNLWRYFKLAWVNYKIYKSKLAMRKKYKDDSMVYYFSILGDLGIARQNDIETFSKKKALLRAMGDLL